MNAFNRIALILVATILIIYCAAGAVVAAGGFVGVAALYAPLAPFAVISGGSAVLAFAICAVIILAAVALLIGEVLSIGPQRSVLTVVQDPAGRVILDRRVVRDVAEQEARSVFGVVQCHMDVRTEHGGLVLAGRLTVDRYVNLLDVSKAARDHVKESVERSLGQTVSEVRLRCTAGSSRRWPSLSMHWLAQLLDQRPRMAAIEDAAVGNKGEFFVRIHPLQIVERAGPVTAGVTAALVIILGLIIIAYPIVLAWAVGLALMLGGVAILVTLYTLHADREAKSTTEQTFAQE